MALFVGGTEDELEARTTGGPIQRSDAVIEGTRGPSVGFCIVLGGLHHFRTKEHEPRTDEAHRSRIRAGIFDFIVGIR